MRRTVWWTGVLDRLKFNEFVFHLKGSFISIAAVVMEIAVFRDVLLCIFLTTKLHGVTRQKTVSFTFVIFIKTSHWSVFWARWLVHSLGQYYCNVLCNIALQFTVRSPIWPLTFRLLEKNYSSMSSLFRVCSMSQTARPPWLRHFDLFSVEQKFRNSILRNIPSPTLTLRHSLSEGYCIIHV